METNNTDLTIDFTNLNPIFAQSELCKAVLLILLLEKNNKNNAVGGANIKDVFNHNKEGINLFAGLKSNELSTDIVNSVSDMANSNDLQLDLLESNLKFLTGNLSSSIAFNETDTIMEGVVDINQYCLHIDGLELDTVISSNHVNESINIYYKQESQMLDIEVSIGDDSYRVIDEYSTVDRVVDSLNDETLCYLNTSFLYDYCDLENCTVVIDAIKETMNTEALKLILNGSLEDIASDMIRLDGAGQCLNSYDGNNEEIYNNGDIYFYFSV